MNFNNLKIFKKFLINNHSYLIWPFFLMMVIYYYFELIKYGFNSYKTGDWLINYYSGFVRRGLIGTFFLGISKLFNFFSSDLKWFIFFFQNIIYFFIFFLIQKIYLLNKPSLGTLILLFSPAYILFPYYDFLGGYRKEIFFFLAFAILAYVYAAGLRSKKLIWLSFFIFLAGILSHETGIFILPFFLFLIFKMELVNILKRKEVIFFSILFIFSSIFVLLFSFLSALNYDQNILISKNICTSLISIGFDKSICQGAISFLQRSFAEVLKESLGSVTTALRLYSVLLILSIFPLFILDWFSSLKNKLLILFSFIVISPLFLIGLDWGRWIHMYIYFVFTIILSDSVYKNLVIKKIHTLVIMGYLTLWSMPHCCTDKIGNGIFLKQVSIVGMFLNKKWEK
jgi:hypothetical protein